MIRSRICKRAAAPALAAALLCAACGEAIPAWQAVRFPSGRVIKVLGVGPAKTADGAPALHLRYQAEAPFDDPAALHAEAAAVWSDFRLEVEAFGASHAVLDAVSPEAPGWDRSRETLQFQVRRGASGDWEFVGIRGARERVVRAADLNSQLARLDAQLSQMEQP